MAQYIVRLLLLLFPTLFVIAVVSFVIIQLPPGDYLTSYIANLAATGETRDRGRDRRPAGAVRPGQTAAGPVPALAVGLRARRLRPVVPVREAGAGADRRAIAVHGGDLAGSHRLHLRDVDPDRHLLGGPAILPRRPPVHGRRLPGSVDPELPAGTGDAVRPLPELRHRRHRPVLRRVYRSAVELRQGRRPAQAPDHPRDRGWDLRHRGAHPHHARQPARRDG